MNKEEEEEIRRRIKQAQQISLRLAGLLGFLRGSASACLALAIMSALVNEPVTGHDLAWAGVLGCIGAIISIIFEIRRGQ